MNYIFVSSKVLSMGSMNSIHLDQIFGNLSLCTLRGGVCVCDVFTLSMFDELSYQSTDPWDLAICELWVFRMRSVSQSSMWFYFFVAINTVVETYLK